MTDSPRRGGTARLLSTQRRRRLAALLVLVALALVAVAATPLGRMTWNTIEAVAGPPGPVKVRPEGGSRRASIAPTRPAHVDAPARPRLTVVGLGDSIASGYACDCTDYVHAVGQHLANLQGRTVVVDNTAMAGATAADVLERLADADVLHSLQAATLVIVQVGANDLDMEAALRAECAPARTAGCFTKDLASVRVEVTKIVQTVRRLSPTATIVMAGYWNVFADGESASGLGPSYAVVSDDVTRWFNDTIREIAAATNSVYADVYTPFKTAPQGITALLAEDGDHPNAAGHALLATSFLAALGDTARIL